MRILSLILAFAFSVATAQVLKKEETAPLKFRHIGPIGNRISCAIGLPGNDLVYFAGAATGGLWRTTDGGLSWKPLMDDKSVASVSALAAAPSDPQVIYAGTGESFIRSNVSIGNGVYRSTDGGDSWQHIGLDNTGRISRILVHPNNPDVVFVAAVGHAYAPQKERGLYKSSDGGKTWKQVLFVDENTGISDMVMDPSNPRILFAGAWQLSLRTWNRTSGGPGSGLFQSVDGGDTWTRLKGNGLPTGAVGKIALTMSAADPNRVYALIETGDGLESIGGKPESGELWRSDNKGKSWTVMSANRNMSGRQAYYTRTLAAPDNANEIHFIQASFHTSIDGGRTLEVTGFGSQPYGDHHDMWIDPTQPRRQIVAHDGGVSITMDRGKSWNRIALPIAQLYHVTVDNNVPYNVLTNRQDGPSMKGPSRSGTGSYLGFPAISTGMWHEVGGGESGFATPDPKDPDIVWSTASGTGAVGGVVVRYNEKTRQFRQVEIWPEYVAGQPAEEVKYRFQWTFPFLISPHDNNTVYATSQVVHRSTNGGQRWEVISPDLTMNDKSKQKKSGGLTPDNIGVEYANVIYAFEESPIKKGLFWTGSNDGLVQVSTNGGKDWTNVTKNLPELPALGTVRNIEASRWNEGKAWLVVDLHEVGNFQPYVYRTSDYGKTWKKITKGIEGGNLNYCRSIKEDPVRKGMLYLGTETKFYVSYDDGDTWQIFMNNLPPTPYYWIEVQEHFNDLVLGTYGRGVWILDDITPLQQYDGTSPAALFKPHDTYRFQPKTSNLQFLPEPSWGDDPPYGVALNYYTTSDKDSVKLYVRNSAGDTVRTFKQKGQAGFNRVWWNLEGKPHKPFVMRTTPIGSDWVGLGKDRTREPHISIPFKSYLVAPGTYEVIMTAGSQKYTSSFKVMKDPHSEGTLEDVTKQDALLKKIHGDINSMTGMVNEMELLRRQLNDLKDVFKTKPALRPMINDAAVLDTAIMNIESKLIQLKFTGTGQDDCRYPEMLVGKMGYLGSAVATADFAPADQHVEVYEVLKARLTEATTEFNTFMKGPFQAFLKKLKDQQVEPVISGWK
ncbi:MAG: WD40/YVTN/BNR-like repeat-containing protein [Bacteroidota bacterium]